MSSEGISKSNGGVYFAAGEKWMEREANWIPSGPLMVPVGIVLMMGSMAGYNGPAACASQYYNEEEPHKPRFLEMHTLLWEKVQREVPEFAALCDVEQKPMGSWITIPT